MVTLPRRMERFLGPGDRPVVLLILVGIILYMISVALSYIDGSLEINVRGWKGFFQKMNWFLFPLFFLLLGLTTIWVMSRFRYAWKSLAKNMAIFETRGLQSYSINIQKLDEIIKLKYLKCSRNICLISILIGLLLSFAEAFSTFSYHFPDLCRVQTDILGDCKDPKPTCSWIPFECGVFEGIRGEARVCWVEKDFSVYGAFIDADKVESNKHIPWISWPVYLMIITQIMQGLLIAIAFILLLQIAVNIGIFGIVSIFPFRNSVGIGIKLNSKDDMGEFGLSAWNSALNVAFFVIAISMIIPVLSAKFQRSGNDYDSGQIIMMVLVPLIWVVPISLSFVIRTILHARLKRQFYELDQEEKEGFSRQDIWPFNKNMMSKTLIAIILSSYIFSWNIAAEKLEWLPKLID